MYSWRPEFCSHLPTARIPFDEPILSVDFSPSGKVLVVRTLSQLHFVRADRMQMIHSMRHAADHRHGRLKIHTSQNLMAAENSVTGCIDVWRVEFDGMLRLADALHRRYGNAKIVLLGDRNSGKSSLASSLTGGTFKSKSIEHSISINHLPLGEDFSDSNTFLTRELALWEMPNSDRYDLVQRLHLDGSAVVLFTLDVGEALGIEGERRINRARKLVDDPTISGKKMVVLTKNDKEQLGTDSQGYLRLREKFGTDTFLTSAKEGTGISALYGAVLEAIDWRSQPSCEPTEEFVQLRAFLERVRQRVTFVQETILLDLFTNSVAQYRSIDIVSKYFRANLDLLERLGLIYRFSFGGQVLLEPSYIHTYSAALVDAAGRDSQGLGRISEDDIFNINGQMQIPEHQRISDAQQENQLLNALLRELTNEDLVFKVTGPQGAVIVFPSELRRPMQPHSEGIKAACCRFRGRAPFAYSSLVVRLLGLDRILITDPELFHNAAVFRARSGGTCTIVLKPKDDINQGELDILFSKDTLGSTRQTFIEFVTKHLAERSSLESLVECSPGEFESRPTEATDAQWDDGQQRKSISVYFSYDPANRLNAESIASSLADEGISPWLLDVDVRPGADKESARKAARECHSIAVVALSGPLGDRTLEDCAYFKSRDCTVIPVILISAPRKFELPGILRNLVAVDFRKPWEGPDRLLARGIIGSPHAGSTPPPRADPAAARFSVVSDSAPPVSAAAGRLEAIVAQVNGLRSTDAFRGEMQAVERRICRIENAGDTAVGTGFLVGPNLVLTNFHVYEALDWQSAVAHFDYHEDHSGQCYRLDGPALATSSVDKLDFALLHLSHPAGKERGWLEPKRHEFGKEDILLILQHPQGRRLELGIGQIGGVTENRITYSTNTDFGSSGAPVFLTDWRLVALHHRGIKHVNNVGIPIATIWDALAMKSLVEPI